MIASYWNTTGPAKDFAFPLNVDRLREWVPREARVLDYGCGYGRGAGLLEAAGYTSLLGVDPATAMVAAARQRCPDLAFDVIDRRPHVSRPDGAFDAVLLTAVLTCVPASADQQGILHEVTRLLQRGGVLHIGDFWIQDDARNRDRYERRRPSSAEYGVFTLPEGVTLRHHSRAWLDALTSGYEPLALDEVTVRTMNGHEARGFQWYGRRG